MPKSERCYYLTVLLGLGILLLWSYWPSLADVAERWAKDPQYAQGYFVPGFALAVLWVRRGHYPGQPLRGTAGGIGLGLAGLALRLAGTHYYAEWLELISLLPCLAGCCLTLGGWRLLHWAAPAIGLLVFMMPLPFRVETALSIPLRRVSTLVSTFFLQTLGFPAVAEENVILVN